MFLGEKLQQLRKQKGMSQEELAEHLAISRQAVSKWELGESLPDTKNIIQLGKLFNVSMDYLLNDNIENITLETTKAITSEQKELTIQPKNKLKISMPMLLGCILSFLGICSILIFWVLSIVNPAEYYMGQPNGTTKIYDGLQGFLMCNKASGLFIFCCCVTVSGLGIMLFGVIKNKKRFLAF